MHSLTGYKIGFIGLGLMGRHMCLNLHRAGANLHIYNRSPQVLDELEQERMTPCGSPAEVCRAADIIILMVSDTPAVEQVLFGDHGLVQGLRPETLVIDMGTTAAVATREFAKRLQPQCVDYIDAPVSGGEFGARDAKLTIMAGGRKAASHEHNPSSTYWAPRLPTSVTSVPGRSPRRRIKSLSA